MRNEEGTQGSGLLGTGDSRKDRPESKVMSNSEQRRGGLKSQMGHYGFGEVTGGAFLPGSAARDNSQQRKEAERSAKPSPGLANTDLDLERDEDVEFEDDNFQDDQGNRTTPGEDHYDVDDEVRMRAKRVIRSRRHSLDDDGSFDEENDSRLVHNVSVFSGPIFNSI